MTTSPPKSLPTPDELERQLTRFVNVTLLGGGDAVDRDTRLFEDGYMNSLRILDLIAMVEKALGARIPDRSVRLANFRTIATIVREGWWSTSDGASALRRCRRGSGGWAGAVSARTGPAGPGTPCRA